MAIVEHHPRYMNPDDVMDVAMQAQYLLNGYEYHFQQISGGGMSELQEQQGHIAVTSRFAELAVVVHDFLQTPEMKEINEQAAWPGVFEYEVTEDMGAWFAENSNCTDEEFLEELKRRTKVFLRQ